MTASPTGGGSPCLRVGPLVTRAGLFQVPAGDLEIVLEAVDPLLRGRHVGFCGPGRFDHASMRLGPGVGHVLTVPRA